MSSIIIWKRKSCDICHIWIEKWQLYYTFFPKTLIITSNQFQRKIIRNVVIIHRCAYCMCTVYYTVHSLLKISQNTDYTFLSSLLQSVQIYEQTIEATPSQWLLMAILHSATECHRVPQSATECHRVPQSATECHRVPQSATECHRVPQSATECHRVPQSATECHRVPQSATECHRVPQSATECHSRVV